MTDHVAELPRHPLHVLLAVGASLRDALRRPHRLRLRRSVRQARARRCAHGDGRATSGPGRPSRQLRADLNAGGSKFCGDCPLKLPLEKDEAPPQRDRRRRRRCPSRLYIECTAACNISCTQACCAPETGITRTRQAGMLDFDLFTRVIDEAGPSLGRIDFFNYGEAFLHKRAVEMCEYIKSKFPHIYLYTSTNGLALHRGAGAPARALGHRRSDVLDRRRVAGELRASTGSAATSTWRSPTCARWPTRSAGAAATCRSSTGATSCSTGTTATRRWTRARQLAADIGVDRLCWEITDHPEDAYSRRFVPGHAGARARSATRSGTTTTSATRFPARRRARDRRAHAAARPAARRAAPARPLHVRTRVQNLSTRPFPRAGELRPPPRAPRRAAVRRRRHADQPRLRARLAARRHSSRAARPTSPIEIPAPDAAGPLRAEVRSGQRRHRLVRALRLADDDAPLWVR